MSAHVLHYLCVALPPGGETPASWPSQRSWAFLQGPHPAKGSERSRWAAHTPRPSSEESEGRTASEAAGHTSPSQPAPWRPQTHVLRERRRVPQAMALRSPPLRRPLQLPRPQSFRARAQARVSPSFSTLRIQTDIPNSCLQVLIIF